MAHIPINHHLQPFYRVLAGLCGLYVLVFGIVGLVQTRGLDTFAQDGLPSVLGLQANRAFAILSIVAGVIVLGGALVGGNLDQRINLGASFVFLAAGLAMMLLLQTDLNFLGFSVATCVVSFVIGLVLLTAALYGKVGSDADVRREEAFRHGRGPDPQPDHPLTASPRAMARSAERHHPAGEETVVETEEVHE
jgi:O-antigen/teichoic acid export membrane protein